MRAYVAVTDRDWYRFLRDRPHLDEVNFWQPGGDRQFKALNSGEPFLFKLHYPENMIVGGGMFATSSILDSQLAWDAFGDKNGARSYEEMRSVGRADVVGALSSPSNQMTLVVLVLGYFKCGSLE